MKLRILLLVMSCMLAVVLTWNTASAGTWADVLADSGDDCYVGPDEVRFSAFAQTVTRCKGEIVMLGTLCFHRMGHPYVDMQAEAYMIGAGYKDAVDLMPQTTSSILACVNAEGRVWIEKDWRSL